MIVSRPNLTDRRLNTPFRIAAQRGYPVYCCYTVRIAYPVGGTDAADTAAASVALLIDDAHPPSLVSSFFGHTRVGWQVAFPAGVAAERDEIVRRLSGVVLGDQWVELRSTIDDGSPLVEVLSAVEVETCQRARYHLPS